MTRRIPCFRQITRLTVLLLMALASSVLTPAVGPAQQEYVVYVGTYTDHGSEGIYAYRFDASTGKLTSLGLAAEAAEPSFLAVDSSGRFLYAVNETSNYKGKPTGAVSAFAIHSETGKLSLLNQVSSHDEGPAHITLDRTGKFALISNYTLGSVAVFPVLKDGRLGEASWFVQHKGSSVNLERQKGPHAHAVALSPDNRFAVVADLGLDQLLVYRFDAVKGSLGTKPQIMRAAPGAGPRHLRFSSNGRFLYVINELHSTVVTYSYNAPTGGLHELQTISTLPKGFNGKSTAAEIEIHPSGKFLFASNRGDDSIALFAIDSHIGTLTHVETDSAKGKTPRNFAIDPTGSWLLAANQDSNQIVVFRIDRKTGHLTPTGETVQVPSPACVKVVEPQ
ncbi:MAG TPA: lactonase family protein [Terriglobales bacterium]|nr:lactonase family protein [Terriglobales bacterium]